MSSYAPLLAKEGHTQWKPDLIYFNNDSITLTPDYHVMRLVGENSGNIYFKSQLEIEHEYPDIINRLAYSVVKDEDTDQFIIKFVNLLPTNLDLNLDLSLIKPQVNNAEITVFQGSPEGSSPLINRNSLEINSNNTLISVPEYSFTIIRL